MTAITSLALDKAVNDLWDEHIDLFIKQHWTEQQKERFITLDENQAMAGTPMPYCVYTMDAPETVARMTKATESEGRQEFHQSLWTFNIYANAKNNQSPKQVAAAIADLILATFGGHPTIEPQQLNMQIGSVINVQYQTDFGRRLDDEVHQWVVRYLITTDQPMAA